MSNAGLNIHTMHLYQTRNNIPWNMEQYNPLREYFDSNKIATQRKRQKGEKAAKPYATKKVSFLDQTLKVTKDLPPPCAYDFKSEFDQTSNIKQSRKHKIDFKLRKNSYLEQIQSSSKRFKVPGVGHYRFHSSSHHKPHRKKAKISDKRFFYENSEFLSTTIPGSGCYYPHDQVPHVKQQRITHHHWIEKHKKEQQAKRKKSLKEPDPGSYRPLSASFNSFDKMNVDHAKRQKKEGNTKPVHGFGSSDCKFKYQRPSKSKGQQRPDPCNYNTMIEWKGKGQDINKNNWVRCLSAGPTRSLYH